jgi:hypothetical protein
MKTLSLILERSGFPALTVRNPSSGVKAWRVIKLFTQAKRDMSVQCVTKIIKHTRNSDYTSGPIMERSRLGALSVEISTHSMIA